MKTCFVYQPSGIGDILFCQKVAKHYREIGYKIVWPIYQYYEWMVPYLEDENISYPILSNDRTILEPFDYSEQFFYLWSATGALFRAPVIAKDFIYIALGPATLIKDELMTAKYSVANIDYDNWQNYAIINRNFEKENDLYYNILNLNDNSHYTLINEYCSTKRIEIPPVGDSVYVKNIPGFSILDWIKVIEKSSRLITVDTSIPHIAEIFLPKNVPCHLINRYDPPSFVDLPKIFRLNWQYCITPNDIIY